MIVRDEGETFLLITQPDHARLAEQIVARMRTEPALESADRDVILLAAREHDNGWIEVDAEPTIEPETGRPRDFMSGPAAVKHDLWLRGIARAAKMDLRAGALVAEHALTVYGYRRGTAEWQSFFESVTALRDDLLQQLGILGGPSREAFEQQYRCVQLGRRVVVAVLPGMARAQCDVRLRGDAAERDADCFPRCVRRCHDRTTGVRAPHSGTPL